ncbi:hypothetical protein [Victivallis sp. Marseille-Q1083]|uniref:hypothetical protein n=1 Tax=Victivallis sp. Marseille-Q1083 TaxID=2717288 RepID=UPI00158B58C7|nr:hypothetical protein [Victivallis sp. Marseille-Q1083]
MSLMTGKNKTDFLFLSGEAAISDCRIRPTRRLTKSGDIADGVEAFPQAGYFG